MRFVRSRDGGTNETEKPSKINGYWRSRMKAKQCRFVLEKFESNCLSQKSSVFGLIRWIAQT